MERLLESLTQQRGEILLGLSVLSVALLFVTVLLWRKVTRQERIWRDLMDGVRGDSLERLLLQHLRERMELSTDLTAVAQRVDTLEQQMLQAKRFIGLVKYDAFDDVGGNQSFALAVYDEQGNGAVITSVVGRQDCRVYSKPLVGLRSERDLSQEELRAIAQAKSSGPRTSVSP
ncbi:MAG: DUF4446 family protein [Fimbriimonas sp.]